MKFKKVISMVVMITLLAGYFGAGSASAITQSELNDFNLRLSTKLRSHLDYLVNNNLVDNLDGKSTDGMMALAYYLTYERTGVTSYKTAAVQLADQILSEMRNTPTGVISIKVVDGVEYGGPPSFAWYTAYAAYVLNKVGGRTADLLYIANSVNNYYWYGDLYPGQDWWASDVQVENGQPDPTEDPTKPTPINKNASMAMAAAMLSSYVAGIDSTLSAKLKSKADASIYNEIIPAQEADGFWHYNLDGNDPNDKDVLGYFMLTTTALVNAKKFTTYYNNPTFDTALNKAYAFALSDIAPMTDPNTGPQSDRATAGTPTHYSPGADITRGFQLGTVLFAGQNYDAGVPIIDLWMQSYPNTNTGADGGDVSRASALMLYLDGAGTDPAVTLYEAESLVTSTSSGDSEYDQTDKLCSGGVWNRGQLNGVGDYVEYIVNVTEPGTYNIKVAQKKKNYSGIWQLKIDGVNQGSPVDGYSAAGVVTEHDLGNVTFTTTGDKYFRFQITGKNASAGDYDTGIDVIKLTK